MWQRGQERKASPLERGGTLSGAQAAGKVGDLILNAAADASALSPVA